MGINISVYHTCDSYKSFYDFFLIACFFPGLCAEEIHVCGEAAAINLVTELMYTTGEEVEVGIFAVQYTVILKNTT